MPLIQLPERNAVMDWLTNCDSAKQELIAKNQIF